ncbi:MAG TPA: ABC transporter ATP-binding protein/permease [Candidatus Eisenbergiella merdigallinarum]|uniref:ABC transporter ATP-binding protein/permease n=1 Tax=Candidatus Eisenbergiella merdigallinarum TaxID=2838552 RepID=A0A9D2MSP3_9FIRM|nr:ABC transporter ATP-binding protein/permease [Candidatus Eisenbergiella merdigallinarum]
MAASIFEQSFSYLYINVFLEYSGQIAEKSLRFIEMAVSVIVGIGGAFLYSFGVSLAATVSGCTLSAFFLGIFYFVCRNNLNKISDAWDLRLQKANAVYQSVWEHVRNAEVTGFLNEDKIGEKYIFQNESYIEALKKHKRVNRISVALSDFFMLLIVLGMGMTGYFLYRKGMVSMGESYALILVFYQFLARLFQIPEFDVLCRELRKTWNTYRELLENMVAGAEKTHVLKDPVRFDLQGVTMGYGEKAVLTDISLSFGRGEFIAIEGVSGSGKTTFIRTLLGLMDPISGRILLNGMEMEKVDLHSLWKRIGYVGKNVLLTEESVERNIVLDSQMDRIKLQRVTGILGIPDEMLQRSSCGNLSSGEKQKIAIARILYQDLPMMILDEALSNLDEKTKVRLVEYFARICKERGKLVLLISHERLILEKTERRIHIHGGVLTEKTG